MKLPLIIALVSPLALFVACNSTIELQIIIADNATIAQRLTANDLKLDLQKASDLEVIVV